MRSIGSRKDVLGYIGVTLILLSGCSGGQSENSVSTATSSTLQRSTAPTPNYGSTPDGGTETSPASVTSTPSEATTPDVAPEISQPVTTCIGIGATTIARSDYAIAGPDTVALIDPSGRVSCYEMDLAGPSSDDYSYAVASPSSRESWIVEKARNSGSPPPSNDPLGADTTPKAGTDITVIHLQNPADHYSLHFKADSTGFGSSEFSSYTRFVPVTFADKSAAVIDLVRRTARPLNGTTLGGVFGDTLLTVTGNTIMATDLVTNRIIWKTVDGYISPDNIGISATANPQWVKHNNLIEVSTGRVISGPSTSPALQAIDPTEPFAVFRGSKDDDQSALAIIDLKTGRKTVDLGLETSAVKKGIYLPIAPIFGGVVALEVGGTSMNHEFAHLSARTGKTTKVSQRLVQTDGNLPVAGSPAWIQTRDGLYIKGTSAD